LPNPYNSGGSGGPTFQTVNPRNLDINHWARNVPKPMQPYEDYI